MKKRLLSLLLTFALVLSLLPGTALAVDEPTEIATQSQLAAMGSGSYKLTADIELDGWTSISFSGTLDGNGHTITLAGTPLFQKINDGATVTNLILSGTVSSESSVGSFAVINNGILRNCLSYADVTYAGTGGSSWSPHYAAGLVGYASADSGTVLNCLYAGTFTPGSAPLYGSIVNNAFFVSSTVHHCVGVGSDRIGMTEGMSSHTVIDTGSNTVIASAGSFVPDDYVALLNGNRQEGDLEWEVKDGALALKAPAPAESASEDDIAALKAAISAAGDAVQSDTLYTASSLSAFQNAFAAANAKAEESSPTKASVINATTALTAAQDGLTVRETAAVMLPDTGVIEITQSNFESKLEYPSAGAYYLLTEDVTITSNYWFGTYNTMNCVLDGNGHTITLKSSPLWGAIGPDGVVQNLGIMSAEGTVVTNSTNDTGAIAADCQGLIVNCWSRADVQSEGMNGIIKNTGGFVANLKSGGAIVNCWNAGTVTAKGSTGTGVAGDITGTAGSNTMVKNCYWQNGDSAVGGGSCIASGNAMKSRADFYSSAFIDLLNSNKGENGRTWALSSAGYPWFGEAQSYTPAEAIQITFTPYAGTASAFSSTDGLTIDLAARSSENYAGELSADGITSWENLSVDSTGQNNPILLYDQNEDGNAEVYIYKAGSVTVRAGGAEFTITVTGPRDASSLRLKVGDTVLADGASLTVQGSEDVVFTAEAQYDGSSEWTVIPASVLTFTGGANTYLNGAVFHATAPGAAAVTATGLGQSVTVNITSEYVPVTSIAPGPGTGTYVIHGRNANSEGLGNFLDLNLSHQAGNVVVSPANASYRDQWTLESSDNDVAEYVEAFLKAVLPKKAGTVTLTATATGEGETAVGTSTITLKYFNPVTSVTFGGGVDFSVAENDSVDLPIAFTGPKSEEGYHVTEPGMIWSFSGDGAVEITRNGNPGILVSTEKEYCVANDRYLITGVTPGTVVVTGTPVDTTGGAAPVIFKVTVTEGAAEVPADVDHLVSAGIRGAQNYLTANAQDRYAFGFEWEIFSLVRSGAPVPQSKLDAYLNSVDETYTTPTEEALKPTTLARVALTLGVLGEDASAFRGLNLIEKLYTSDRITDTGNESMWALIALDSKGYTVPESAVWTREQLINEILHYQNTIGANIKGGFGLSGSEQVSVDMTAMALQALAPYYDDAHQDVKAAVDLALDWLKTQLDRNCVAGGTSESTAQVLVALAALGIDPTDTSEDGFAASAARNLITALTSFQLENGGFRHSSTSSAATSMSTIQALYSLEAYRRFAAAEQENRLFDLTDVSCSARSVLENRLKEANRLIEGDYTEESWAAMAAQRAAAQTVFERQDAADEDLRSADRALAAAIAALVKASAEPGPGEAGGSIQVYVTLSNAGQVVMAQKAVTATDYNQSGSFDVDDVLYAAHKAAYPGGAANGYSSAETQYGLSITKLWGDTSGRYGYWLNHNSCWSLNDTVAAGDHVVAFVYQNADYSDAYSKFDSYTYSARTGETLRLSLENAGYDESWNVVFTPLSSANITVCDSNLTPLSTDSYAVTNSGSGAYSVMFRKAGTYYLVADCSDPVIVPAVCQVTVTSAQGGADGSIKASISVKDPQGKTYLSKTSYTLAEGSTVYDLLRGTGLELTTTNYSYGIYIKAIEGLGEFDQGAQSGWMYRVNGVFPEVSCDSYVLENLDNVEWLYTRDLGSDVGGQGSDASAAADTVLKPEASMKDGVATSAVSGKAIESAISAVKKDGTSAIVIAPIGTEKGTEAAVELLKAAVEAIVQDTDASLRIETDKGTVSIPHDALASVAAQATGSDVTISVAQKSADDGKNASVDTGGAVIVEVTVKSGNTEITGFGGRSITISIPAGSEHKAGEYYKVIAVSADGRTETMTGKCVKIDGKTVIQVTAAYPAAFIATAEKMLAFTDVKESDYFYDAVMWAVGKGITNGTTATTFSPGASCTRAQMVTFLWRAAGSPAPSGKANSFTDVKEDAYYFEALLWAVENGITNGTTATTFSPDAACSRGQMAAFLYRSARTPAVTGSAAFTDVKDSDYFSDAVVWAAQEGITNGTTATTFSPNATCTRGQMVTFLYRYLAD